MRLHLDEAFFLSGPKAIVRVDPAPGFVALRNDKTLAQNNIAHEFGRVKNPNHNPVAEKAIQELELELLKSSCSGPITPLKLAITTAALNARIRSRGLSAREMIMQRDQFTHVQLPLSDRELITSQRDSRTINHPHSQKSKGFSPCVAPTLQPGDLVFLSMDKSKTHARDRYMVSSVDGEWCFVKKFAGPTIRDTSYRVKRSDCILVPTNIPKMDNSLLDPKITDDLPLPSETPKPNYREHDNVEPLSAPLIKTSDHLITEHVPVELIEPPVDIAPPCSTVELSAPVMDNAETRPPRNRHPPKWFKDYVYD